MVATRARADAYFAHLAPELTGPDLGVAREAALLRWLGRNIDPGAADDAEGHRLVEPGVGRSVLVDRLSVEGRPELVDFSALGVGVTPYASGGYVNVGRPIDGLAGLDRSLHRRDCAARLEAAGCRAGQVVAVIGLRDAAIDLPHAAGVPAAIAVRGFRCVLRVKQLDPVGPFLHSHQHAPAAHDLLLHPGWDAATANRRAEVAPDAALLEQKTLVGLETYAQACSLGQLTRHALAPPPYAGLHAALARRLGILRLYAPTLIGLARARLATELGRDPAREAPDNRAYATWFAETIGRQLATFHRLRFLHDYHHCGVARTKPGTMHSLGENNVSLLAEFPDLDTGIFVDRYDAAQADALFLTRADHDVLASGFTGFHLRDVAAAREVVQTLAFVALDGDASGIARALAAYDAAYARGLEAAVCVDGLRGAPAVSRRAAICRCRAGRTAASSGPRRRPRAASGAAAARVRTRGRRGR